MADHQGCADHGSAPFSCRRLSHNRSQAVNQNCIFCIIKRASVLKRSISVDGVGEGKGGGSQSWTNCSSRTLALSETGTFRDRIFEMCPLVRCSRRASSTCVTRAIWQRNFTAATSSSSLMKAYYAFSERLSKRRHLPTCPSLENAREMIRPAVWL